MLPVNPLAEELAGAALEKTKFAAKIFELTVLSEGEPEGSLIIKTLSVAATFAAVGNSVALIPVLDMIIQEELYRQKHLL